MTNGQRRQYSFQSHGITTTKVAAGKMITKPNAAKHMRPTWKQGAATVIRPLPPVDPETKEFLPYRSSSEARDFTDWVRGYPVVRNFGPDKLTFLMSNPADPTAVDVASHPGYILPNAIMQAVKQGSHPEWAPLVEKKPDRGALVTFPQNVLLIRAAVMQAGADVFQPPEGLAPGGLPVIFELTAGAGDKFIDELELIREGADPASNDWESMFVNGDPVAINGGRFLVIYRAEDGPPQQQQQASNGAAMWTQTGRRAANTDKGYDMHLTSEFNGSAAGSLAAVQELVRAQMTKDWDDLLQFLPLEEQAHAMARQLPPAAAVYAFRNHPDWVPEDVKTASVAAVAVGPASFNNGAAGFGAAPAAGFGAAPAAGFGAAPVTSTPAGFGGNPATTGDPAAVNPTAVNPSGEPAGTGFSGFGPAPGAVNTPPAGFGAPPAATTAEAAPFTGGAAPASTPPADGASLIPPGAFGQTPAGFAVPATGQPETGQPASPQNSRGAAALEMARQAAQSPANSPAGGQ